MKRHEDPALQACMSEIKGNQLSIKNSNKRNVNIIWVCVFEKIERNCSRNVFYPCVEVFNKQMLLNYPDIAEGSL